MKTLVAALAALTLTGCTNYAGKGNAFDAQGKITTVRDHTITVRIDRVDIADGRSFRHVKRGLRATFHDNWNECDISHSRKWSGPRATTWHVGQYVRVTGKRRENADVCGKNARYSYRLVTDTVTPVAR